MYPGGYYFSQPTPNKGPGQKAPPPPRYPHPGGTSSSNNYASQTNYNKGYSSSAARAAPKPEEFKTPIAPNTVIRVYTTDISRLEVDAVVNASNQNLKHLGGVAGALLAAAGYQLQTATEDYLWKNHLHEIPVGNAMHTPGFLLPAKHVIHAVGPSGHDIRDEKKFRQLLENAFLNTFKEAQSLEVKTLGLPLISSGIYAGRFSKEMCSEVLWKAIIGAGELVRTLSELHLVNNDPDVTRAILYVAHNHPDVSGMLTGSDRNGGSSSNDMDVDWDRDRESSQRREAGGHHYGDEGRSSGAASDRQLLITFETEDEKHKTSTQHDEEMMLFGGQWVPKSQLPQTAAPKPSENVDRHIRTAGSSKTDDTEEERKSGLLASFAPFRDIPEKVGSFLGSPGAAISTMLSPTAPTRADVHKVDPSLMVPSAEKTALKCGACARQPNSNNAEWFVQLPCSHYSCISCFNSRVQKTHDTSCSNCSKTFELPTPANKSQFLFCPDPKGESYVLNPKDNVRSELEYYRMYKIQYSNEFNVNNLYL